MGIPPFLSFNIWVAWVLFLIFTKRLCDLYTPKFMGNTSWLSVLHYMSSLGGNLNFHGREKGHEPCVLLTFSAWKGARIALRVNPYAKLQ